jgi:hypothetical protein
MFNYFALAALTSADCCYSECSLGTITMQMDAYLYYFTLVRFFPDTNQLHRVTTVNTVSFFFRSRVSRNEPFT